MRIFLAGATGVIGRRLLPRLLEAGHSVHALTRSQGRADALREAGAAPVVGDVFDLPWLCEALAGVRPEVVIHQLTALPARIDPRRIARVMRPTNRLRTEGTRNLVEAAVRAGARRMLSQSIAFVLRPAGPPLGNEDEPLYLDAPRSFRPMIEAVRELEERTCGSSLEGIVLRYGSFYGSGTIYARDGTFAEDVLRRRIPLSGRGEGVFSFIHVDDAAAATVLAVSADARGVFAIVDDEPAPVATWLPYYAAQLGAKRPRRLPRWLVRLAAGPYATYLMNQQRGIANARARQALDWEPRISSWRTGFQEL